MLSGNVFYYRNQLDQFKSITVENVIGKGGFGTVYRAILDGYGAIAVKDQIATKSKFQTHNWVGKSVCVDPRWI